MTALKKYFTKFEIALWGTSIACIIAGFVVFEGSSFLTLIASLVGVSAILIYSKGNPIGQLLMVIFSVLYGIISFSSHYYGEMVTYLGMTGPMAVFAFVSWLRHPYKGNRSQVEVNEIKRPEYGLLIVLTIVVTVAFYFILAYFDTASLLVSTLSVTTSFVAVYLTWRRSKFFSLAYACNDVVLIVLWTIASTIDRRYISVIICFIAFLANDIYAFINISRLALCQKLVDNSIS